MKKILIVDDDHHVRLCVKAIFNKAGFATTEVVDGISAIKHLHANKPDVIILDHDMPFMTGLETLKEFKKIAPDVPVVMFSGSNNRALSIEAIREGAAFFIQKPADNEEIITAVQKALGIWNMSFNPPGMSGG